MNGSTAGFPGSRGETESSTNVSQILLQREAEGREKKAASLNTSFTASGTTGRGAFSSRVSPIRTNNPSAHQSPKPKLRQNTEKPLDAVQMALKSLILSAKGFISAINPIIRTVKDSSFHQKYTKLTSAVDFSTQILEAAELNTESFCQNLLLDLEKERRRSEKLLESLHTRSQQSSQRDKQLLGALVATANAHLEARLTQVSYNLQNVENRLNAAAEAVKRLIKRLRAAKNSEIRLKTVSKELTRMKTFEMLYYKTQKAVLNLQKDAFERKQKQSQKATLEREIWKLRSETSSLDEVLDSRIGLEGSFEGLNMHICDLESHFLRIQTSLISQTRTSSHSLMLYEDLRSALYRSELNRQELQVQVGDLMAENSVLGSENSFLNRECEEMKAESPLLDFGSEETVREMKEVIVEMQRELQAAGYREERLKGQLEAAEERGKLYFEREKMGIEDENRTLERVKTIQTLRKRLENEHLLEKQIESMEITLAQHQERLKMAQEDEMRYTQRAEMLKSLRKRLEKHYDLMRENEHLKSRVTQQQYVHEHLHKRIQDYSSNLSVSTPVLPYESPPKSLAADFNLKMQYETMVKYQEMLCLGYFQVAAKVTQVQSTFGELRKRGKLLGMLEAERNRADAEMLSAVESGLEDIRGLWVELREKYEAAGGVMATKTPQNEGKEEASLLELLRNSDQLDSISIPIPKATQSYASQELSGRLQLLAEIQALFSPYVSELDHLFPLLKSLLPKLKEEAEDLPISTCAPSLPGTGDLVSCKALCTLDPAPVFNFRSMCEDLGTARAVQDFSGSPKSLAALKEAVMMLVKAATPQSKYSEQLVPALRSYFS